MAAQTTAGASGTAPAPNKTLLAAWALFLDYNKESILQKQQHINRRKVVIYLGLLSSVLAVIYAYLSGSSDPTLELIVKPIIQVALIVLPVVIGLWMSRVQRIPPKDWATCRIAAELYRREIYLFRMNAGVYRNAENRFVTFAQQLAAVETKIQGYGTPKMRSVTERTRETGGVPGNAPVDTDESIITKVKNLPGKPTEDDGLSPISGQQYIDLRLKSQMDYYDRKSVDDARSDDRWTLFGSIITALGALLALWSPTAPFVAITGAWGIAVGLLMNLNLIGKTNAIYRWAYQRLRLIEVKWNALLESGKANDAEQLAGIVEEVENVFQSERETWLEQVIQSTEIVENSLREKYERLKTEVKADA